MASTNPDKSFRRKKAPDIFESTREFGKEIEEYRFACLRFLQGLVSSAIFFVENNPHQESPVSKRNLIAYHLELPVPPITVRELCAKLIGETAKITALTLPGLGTHQRRVKEMVELLAQDLGITGQQLEELSWAAQIHDFGKLRVAPNIVCQDGKISAQQFCRIKTHPKLAADMIGALVPEKTRDTILHHHERYDGQGYPDALPKELQTTECAIIKACDCADAMRTRAYNRGRRKNGVLAGDRIIYELERGSGQEFDPEIIRAFQKSKAKKILSL